MTGHFDDAATSTFGIISWPNPASPETAPAVTVGRCHLVRVVSYVQPASPR
jgi:hypothetical protein